MVLLYAVICARFHCSLVVCELLCILPEVFLEAVPLPSGRGVTVYISPPPYLASAGLGNVVVVVVVNTRELHIKDVVISILRFD